MKIKGIAKNLSYKKLFVGSGIAALLLTALRCWQATRLLDPASGFFTDKNHPTVWLFYILTVGLAVLGILLFYLAGDRGAGEIAARRSVPHAAAALAMAAAVGMDAFGAWQTPREGGSGGKLLIARAVFGALAAVVFLLDCAFFLTGAGFGKKLRILRLIPVVWAFFITVSFFAVTASYLHSSQLLLTIFGAAFLMMFLFEYARKVAGVNAADNTAVFCGTGLVAASLLFAAALPALLLYFTQHVEIAYAPFSFYQLAGALFCVTALCLPRGEEPALPTAPFPAEETSAADAPAEEKAP